MNGSMRNRKGKGMRTWEFEVAGRESHDSSIFYSRKLYENSAFPKPSPRDLMEIKFYQNS